MELFRSIVWHLTLSISGVALHCSEQTHGQTPISHHVQVQVQLRPSTTEASWMTQFVSYMYT